MKRKHGIALISLVLILLGTLFGMLRARLPPSDPAYQGPESQESTSGRQQWESSTREILHKDLLQEYGERPDELIFIDSMAGEGQVMATARYKVPGIHSEAVERFFMEKSGMARLTFTCCGWEPEHGRNGQLQSESLREINPGYLLVITMFADAVIENADGELYLETERENIAYFEVIVEVLDL